MHKTNVKLRFCLPLLSFFFASITILPCSSVSLGQSNPSSDIVRKILSAQRNLINYRCSAEYITIISYESRKRDLEMARRSGDFPAEVIKVLDDDLQGSGKKYQLQDVVADTTGRIKTNSIVGDYDDAGNRHAIRKKVHVWDGEMGIFYTDKLQDNYHGGVVINAKKQDDFPAMRRPLRSFGGRFLEALAKASSQNKRIELEQDTADGTWQISFEVDDPVFRIKNCTWKFTIDPSKNYSVTNGESARPDGLGFRFSADYQEIKDGIWFPVNGKMEGFSADGLKQGITNAKITNIVINDPNLGKTAFHIDFPKGTRVTDRIGGIAYVVGDPSSVRMLGESLNMGHIVNEQLKNGESGKTNDESEWAKLFIPKADLALEKNEPFVLSIPDSKLLNSRNKPESEESSKFLKDLGKGDIAWDGEIVATRGAKVLTIKQESGRPLKLTNGKWTGSYQLPDKVKLPYSMLVVTNEGANYLVKIIKIEPSGITVSYRQLNPDELSLYKQESEDS